ncbi:hypothetical protein ATY43_11420 [Xanthomonas oryzae pv. oryzae]|nr:hypothetical protein AZ54_08400 [Xanthomonas oryzae pv. oryzae PXO86]ALZ71411.1 hypothetical protein APZ20_07820 [Xanthomonas oryzae pv. oryzae]AOS06583.1 hypothetical protein ATY43_11420 [Xanthomonas oryzae pv. oryzae]AOS10238.1 hypothetical protein ATY44_07870 [Xanthomonas oryzae pv. oryzae]AOS14408.1 hypothetical protein ATY45_07655 [Xanthomonas oryzae pv. oryzae]
MSMPQAKSASGMRDVIADRRVECGFTSLEHRLDKAAPMLIYTAASTLDRNTNGCEVIQAT